MNLLALDPGGTTGYARFLQDEEGWYINEVGEVSKDDILQWIENTGPDIYVVENYRDRPNDFRGNRGRRWSEGETHRIIGAIDSRARRIGSPIVLQEPSIKPVGYGWAGMKYVKGKKGMHRQDAIAHGVYYLIKTLGVNIGCLKLAR